MVLYFTGTGKAVGTFGTSVRDSQGISEKERGTEDL